MHTHIASLNIYTLPHDLTLYPLSVCSISLIFSHFFVVVFVDDALVGSLA